MAHKAAGMTLAMHLCRGIFKSTHAAGNYEPVTEALLSEMNRNGAATAPPNDEIQGLPVGSPHRTLKDSS